MAYDREQFTMSFCPQYLPKAPWIVKTRNGLILHYFETKFKKKIFQIFSPNTLCAPHILRQLCPGKRRRRRHWRKQRVPSQCPHRWPTFHGTIWTSIKLQMRRRLPTLFGLPCMQRFGEARIAKSTERTVKCRPMKTVYYCWSLKEVCLGFGGS